MQCFAIVAHVGVIVGIGVITTCRAALQAARGFEDWTVVDHSVLAQAAEGRNNVSN